MLDLLHYSKRHVRHRGATLFREGDAFGGKLHLLFDGDVNISQRVALQTHDNVDLQTNKHTADLYRSRADYHFKSVGVKGEGEFLENDLLMASMRYRHTATVTSEAALVVYIDMNMLLAIDKVYALMNTCNEAMSFQPIPQHCFDARVKQSDADDGKDQTIIESGLINVDADKISSQQIQHIKNLDWNPIKDQGIQFGYNTLIKRIGRSRDRHVSPEETRLKTKTKADYELVSKPLPTPASLPHASNRQSNPARSRMTNTHGRSESMDESAKNRSIQPERQVIQATQSRSLDKSIPVCNLAFTQP